MKINKSGATFSSIVGIGAKLKKRSEEEGLEYLFLNRGVNAVCTIDLTEVITSIDFNSTRIQVYPPNQGLPELRNAIKGHYFLGQSSAENISIVAGGMSGLDLTVQCLQLNTLYFARYYWGSYAKLAKIRGVSTETYDDLTQLVKLAQEQKIDENTAVVICDPNNPTGAKLDDGFLLKSIRQLDEHGVTVIFDSPYRYVFNSANDDLFSQLASLEHVIITESFSKSMGLSGQRIGFIHSQNKEFNTELNIRILYNMNGVNAFAQELVFQLLTSSAGKKAVQDFRQRTQTDIRKNLIFLMENGLLADELYEGKEPVGIFAVVNKTEEELLKYRIGSVSMDYFCKEKTIQTHALSRICLSVPHQQFLTFFRKLPAPHMADSSY
jgi:aspartate aminotransferase